MKRRPPVSKRTATRFPYTTLVRSAASGGVTLRQGIAAGRRCRWYGAKHGSTLESFRSPDRDAERRVRALYARGRERSEEHTSELQSLMRISYAVFCLKTKNKDTQQLVQQIYSQRCKHTETTH